MISASQGPLDIQRAPSASNFTSDYEANPNIPGNGTWTDRSGDTTISQHSGCWGPTGPAEARVGPNSTYESHTNEDGSTTVTVNGETKTYPGKVDFDQENHPRNWDWSNPPAETTTRFTTGTGYQPGLGGSKTTTTVHSIGGSSIETTERTTYPEFGGEFTTAGKTTVHVGANDNVSVVNNADGSADVTINGVTQHLSPEQAKDLQVVKDPPR